MLLHIYKYIYIYTQYIILAYELHILLLIFLTTPSFTVSICLTKFQSIIPKSLGNIYVCTIHKKIKNKQINNISKIKGEHLPS